MNDSNTKAQLLRWLRVPALLAAGLLASGLGASAASAQTPKRGGTAVMVIGTDPLSLSPDTTNSVSPLVTSRLLDISAMWVSRSFSMRIGSASVLRV